MSAHAPQRPAARGAPPSADSARKPGAVAARLGSVLAFTVAGALFATSAVTADGSDLRAAGRTSLPDLIRDRESLVTDLERNVEAARDRLNEVTAGHESAGLAAARTQALALAPAAGLTAVTGPAITVTLDDSDHAPAQGEVTDGLTLDDYIVHQQDLEAVVNALWAGGAEAMMIMDQRVIGTSAVRCVGNVLSLQARTYSPPYTVSAIGNVERMTSALAASEAVSIYREYADELGLGFEVSFAEPEMTFPPYAGSLLLQHARPAQPEDELSTTEVSS